MYLRLLEKVLEKWFFKHKVLILIGARQVGKTTLLQQLLSKREEPSLWFNGEEAYVKQIFSEPSSAVFKQLIGNNKIVVIDEAQQIRNIGLCLKMMFDTLPKDIQIIATGSSALEIADAVMEPLTGRHFTFHLYPLSMSEVYNENQNLDLIQNKNWHLVYGSYPDVVNHRADAKKYLKSIANSYLYKDILAWKDIRKPDVLDKLLQLLAHQMCNETSINELATQLKVKAETVDTYIDLLEKAFVVFRLKSYSTNQRKEVSKMRKIYFWDNGIRNAIINNFNDAGSRTDIGVLWENFLVSERIKRNAYKELDIQYFFWRSMQQQEVDFVETENQHLSAFEMKWNSKGGITKAFTNLYPASNTEVINQDNFIEFLR
jgi:uncharacterized protein